MDDRAAWRRRVYPLAVLAALVVVVLGSVLTADGADLRSGRLGGDLPEFVGAGRIVADGDADQLYDPARQIEAQGDLWGEADDDGGSGILFAYPAIVAGPYSLVADWSFPAVYLVHTTLMVLAVVVAARLLADRLPLLTGTAWIPLGLAVALTFLPMFIGVFNGQVTALALLAVVAVWALLRDGRDLAAGLVAGLAVVKPQYGLPLVALLALDRRWRGLAGASVGVGVVLVGSTLVAGAGWVGDWWSLVRSLSDIDGGTNLSNEVSWLGLAEVALGQGSRAALGAWVALSAATVGLVLVHLRGRRVADPLVPALVLPALLLVAPHSLYYDAGLLLIALAALLPSVPPQRRPLVAGLWWAFGLTHIWAGALGVEPVALLVIGTFAWAVATARRPSLAR